MEKSKFLEYFKVFESKGVNLEELYPKLLTYVKLLQEWNEKINLTSIIEDEDIFIKHFYDSLLPSLYFDTNDRLLADIGSGAGFPGAVLALAYPSLKVTLIDATQKKFLFLNELKDTLQIENLSFYVGRVELIKDLRTHFDYVISRGFASTRIQIEVGTPLLKRNGLNIAMKSLKAEQEDTEAKPTMKKMYVSFVEKHKDYLPISGDLRATYIYKKDKDTANKYPRAWSLIISKSL